MGIALSKLSLLNAKRIIIFRLVYFELWMQIMYSYINVLQKSFWIGDMLWQCKACQDKAHGNIILFTQGWHAAEQVYSPQDHAKDIAHITFSDYGLPNYNGNEQNIPTMSIVATACSATNVKTFCTAIVIRVNIERIKIELLRRGWTSRQMLKCCFQLQRPVAESQPSGKPWMASWHRRIMGKPILQLQATWRRPGLIFTFLIFLDSLKSGTVCMPVPSTSQTSASAMDQRPVTPDRISAAPRKNVGNTAPSTKTIIVTMHIEQTMNGMII